MDTVIDHETQKRLNTPLQNPGGFSGDDQTFLDQIVAKMENANINLYVPSSIINNDVYDRLPDQEKAKVDMQAFTTLAALREIYNLWKSSQTVTFQLGYLVTKVRLTKEKFEKEAGDVFII